MLPNIIIKSLPEKIQETQTITLQDWATLGADETVESFINAITENQAQYIDVSQEHHTLRENFCENLFASLKDVKNPDGSPLTLIIPCNTTGLNTSLTAEIIIDFIQKTKNNWHIAFSSPNKKLYKEADEENCTAILNAINTASENIKLIKIDGMLPSSFNIISDKSFANLIENLEIDCTIDNIAELKLLQSILSNLKISKLNLLLNSDQYLNEQLGDFFSQVCQNNYLEKLKFSFKREKEGQRESIFLEEFPTNSISTICELDISGNTFDEFHFLVAALQEGQFFSNITRINLSNCQLNLEHVKDILSIKKINTLDLSNNLISSKIFDYLLKNETLDSINLKNNGHLSDKLYYEKLINFIKNNKTLNLLSINSFKVDVPNDIINQFIDAYEKNPIMEINTEIEGRPGIIKKITENKNIQIIDIPTETEKPVTLILRDLVTHRASLSHTYFAYFNSKNERTMINLLIHALENNHHEECINLTSQVFKNSKKYSSDFKPICVKINSIAETEISIRLRNYITLN